MGTTLSTEWAIRPPYCLCRAASPSYYSSRNSATMIIDELSEPRVLSSPVSPSLCQVATNRCRVFPRCVVCHSDVAEPRVLSSPVSPSLCQRATHRCSVLPRCVVCHSDVAEPRVLSSLVSPSPCQRATHRCPVFLRSKYRTKRRPICSSSRTCCASCSA